MFFFSTKMIARTHNKSISISIETSDKMCHVNIEN